MWPITHKNKSNDMTKIENKVAILGCGNGGMALAADLKLKGAKVALWSDPAHARKFNHIRNKGEIILHDDNKNLSAKLDLISHDLSEVIKFGDIIYNCTPMVVHVSLFKKLTYLNKVNAIKLLINLSGVFSGLDQFLRSKDQTIFNKIKVFDTSTFPYACRAGDSNDVSILGRKSELAIAPLFPSDHYYLDSLPECCKPIKFKVEENSFKLGLMGTNAVFHPATVLFNARLIDNGCSFLFYREGISKKTSLLHEALDNERLHLAKAMDYELSPCVEDDNKYYGTNFTNGYDFSINSAVHRTIKSPTTLNHRFVTEDIAYGLVPLTTLGKIYNVALPNIESVVHIFSTIMDINYYQYGRNLAGLTKKLIYDISHLTNIPMSA